MCFVRPAVRAEDGSKREVIQITSHSPSTRRRILTNCVAPRLTLSQPIPPHTAPGRSLVSWLGGPVDVHYTWSDLRSNRLALPLDVDFTISLVRKGPSPRTGHA